MWVGAFQANIKIVLKYSRDKRNGKPFETVIPVSINRFFSLERTKLRFMTFSLFVNNSFRSLKTSPLIFGCAFRFLIRKHNTSVIKLVCRRTKKKFLCVQLWGKQKQNTKLPKRPSIQKSSRHNRPKHFVAFYMNFEEHLRSIVFPEIGFSMFNLVRVGIFDIWRAVKNFLAWRNPRRFFFFSSSFRLLMVSIM